jgi:hypothetical protein
LLQAPTPDHPDPQILTRTAADVLLQDHGLGAVEPRDHLHQVAEATGIAAQHNPFSIGTNQHLHDTGEADLIGHEVHIHWKPNQKRSRDRQIVLGKDLVGIELVFDSLDGLAGINHFNAKMFELA